jgi:hypothetical protein
MAKARKSPAIDDFRTRFFRVLHSHYSASRAIAQICQGEALGLFTKLTYGLPVLDSEAIGVVWKAAKDITVP